jgi:hypothetical protein
MVDTQKIIKVASYLNKIHHTKGRIRLRVSPKIKEEAGTITLADIKALPQKINGIEHIKINEMIGSITVKYDHSIFPYPLWEDLLAKRNTQEIANILTQLEKEVV